MLPRGRSGRDFSVPKRQAMRIVVGAIAAYCLFATIFLFGVTPSCRTSEREETSTTVELNGADRGSAADVENVDGASLDARGSHDRPRLAR